MSQPKRNCPSCKHFNYYEGNVYEGEGPNGYYCDGREDTYKKMNGPRGSAYIERAKRCWTAPTAQESEGEK